MRKMLTVAWREFRHTAMTKAFLFGAIVMPILMMGLFIVVIPLMAESNNTPLLGTVVIIAPEDVVNELQIQIAKGGTNAKEIVKQLPDIVQNDPLANAMLGADSETDITLLAVSGDEIDALKNKVRSSE